MDCVEKDLHRTGMSRCDIKTGHCDWWRALVHEIAGVLWFLPDRASVALLLYLSFWHAFKADACVCVLQQIAQELHWNLVPVPPWGSWLGLSIRSVTFVVDSGCMSALVYSVVWWFCLFVYVSHCTAVHYCIISYSYHYFLLQFCPCLVKVWFVTVAECEWSAEFVLCSNMSVFMLYIILLYRVV